MGQRLTHEAMHPGMTHRGVGSVSDPAASNFIPAERHKHLYADAMAVISRDGESYLDLLTPEPTRCGRPPKPWPPT